MAYVIPPNNLKDGDPDPPKDMDNVSDMLTLLTPVMTTVQTSTYSPGMNEVVPFDTTSAACTLNLPAAPPDRAYVTTLIVRGANPLTVNVSASDKFQDGTVSQLLSSASSALMLRYRAASALWYMTAVPQPSVVVSGNIDPTGGTACDAAFLAAITNGAGKTITVPPGIFLFNQATALSLTVPGTRLIGSGKGATFLKIGAGFSAPRLIQLLANLCEVRDLAIIGASTTTSANPVCNAIEVTGAQQCAVEDVFWQYINGWAILPAGTATVANHDLMITRPVIRNCAAGIHCLGNSGTSFQGEYFLTDIQMQQMGVTTGPMAGLPAMLIEDVEDVTVENVNIGTAATTLGGAILVTGASATIKFSNTDAGSNHISGAAPAIYVTSGTNGTPGDVTFSGGTAEGGTNSIQVDAGNHITFSGMRAHQAYVSGLVANGGEVLFLGCGSDSNNQAGGTGYDIDCSADTGNARFIACRTESAVGVATPGQVTNPVATNTHGYFLNCLFIGGNTTPATVFNGTPQIVRGCVGYNPRGPISAPTITASPATISTSQQEVIIIFTAINSLTAFKIGGTAVGVLPVAGVPYSIQARTSLELDYSGTAPTWQWFGN